MKAGTLLSYRPMALDFAPRAREAIEDWSLSWRVPVDIRPGQHPLQRLADHLFFLDATAGWWEIDPAQDGPTGWRRGGADGAELCASSVGAPLILGSAGEISRWRRDGPPEPLTTLPREARARLLRGLGEDRALLQEIDAAGGEHHGVIDLGSGEWLWRRPGWPAYLVPGPGLLLAVSARRGVVEIEALDQEGGAALWQQRQVIDRLPVPVAWAGDGPWLNDSGHLRCYAPQSGEICHEAELQGNAVGQGVLDAEGCYHATHGLAYEVVDLRAGGGQTHYRYFPWQIEGPSTAPGQEAIPLTDGGLLFRDDHGGLFHLAGGDEQPVRVGAAEGPVQALEVIGGRAYLLEADSLVCLGTG